MVDLEHIQVLTIVTVSIFMTGAQVPLCTPGEEQQPHNITLNRTGSPVIWLKDNSQIVLCVSLCEDYSDSNGYNGIVSSSTSTLIIYSVTRQSLGTYTCSAGTQNTSCDFRVYARPTSVSCQPAVFQADTVTVVCTGAGIFPSPFCKFKWIINSTESHSLQEQLTVNQTQYGHPVYYNASCSWKLPARDFSVGSYQFQVRVYPNVTGNDTDTAYGVDSIWTSPQSVVYPSVRLECPNTNPSVQEGKPFSCTCRETANTFILATTTLSYGSTRNNSVNNVTASFTADRTKGEVFCEAQIPDGTNVTVNTTIQVAYGPSSVTTRVTYNQTESDVISLCDQPVTVTVTCSAHDARPGVNYQLSTNVTDTPAGLSNMSAVDYTVTRGGLFYFLCTANNSQFSSLSASQRKTVQVTAPPNPPVIEIYSDGGTPIMVAGDQLTVPEGMVRIGCRVEGGYPPVSGLLLECGSQTIGDSNVFMEVNISRRMDDSSCSCTATHNSSCYRNNKALTVLDVRFGPSVFSFEANNNSEQIILEQNSSVNFSCQAEGNPSPRLSLKKNVAELQMFSDPSSKFNLTLSYSNTRAECLDTGVYTCLAEAGQRTTTKILAVYVKCKPQFRDPEIPNQIYKERVNGTVLINVTVFGYPEPNMALSSDKYNLSSKDYALSYMKLEPPYGSVSLMINLKNEQYFQNYTLHISNAEGPLRYSFEIVDGDPISSESIDTPGPDVGAIVGGVVAAVLVIIIIFVIAVLWKRRGAPCKGKKQRNGNALMDTTYGSDLSVNHRPGSGEEEVTIDNSVLYHMGEKSMRSDEVTVDNSDLYNLNWRSDEVEVDNSDLYNLNRPVPGVMVRDSQYKNYSDVTPTITTASSLPLNMKNKKPQDASNPYEDVSSGEKTKPKPPAAQKPKPVAKPKPQPKNTAPDQTYAMVVKVPKSGKPFAIKEEKDEFFFDPSLQPEIPDKNYENPYEDTNSEKIKEKKSSGRKKKNGKPNGKASEQHKNPSSSGHTNSGFSNPEEEVNVYANT